jgi:D-glycero-alpha-D-manno-heptose-7-phosphate kinase|tara:strand:- start:938 stop:1921 length:984 start_codon:yes stop_codon:yes gene_type:complete
MTEKITAYAPHRISYCGGGTDFPAFFDKFGGSVISCSISRFSKIRLELTRNGQMEIKSANTGEQYIGTMEEMKEHKDSMPVQAIILENVSANIDIESEVPPGSGLGSSGTLAVNLINSLRNLKGENRLEDLDLANAAYELERNKMSKSVGLQDQIAAAAGGFNFIEFSKNRIEIIPFDKGIANEIVERTLLFYLGMTRDANKILKSQEQKIETEKLLELLQQTNLLCKKMKNCMHDRKFKEVGLTLENAWDLKKQFTENITNPLIDNVHDTAISAGAHGAKVTGAGGGGHFLVFAEKEHHENIVKNLTKLNCKYIPFDISNKGAWIE